MTTALPARVSLSRNEDLRLAFELVDESGDPVARPAGTWTFVLKSRGVEIPITLTERSTNIFDAVALVADLDDDMPVGRLFTGDLVRVSSGATSVWASVAIVREDVVQETDDLGTRIVRVTRGDGETISVVLAAGSALAFVQSLDPLRATSTTSNTIGTGTKSFTIETNKAFFAGQRIRILAGSSIFMDASITSYNDETGALVVSSDYVSGSGSFGSWNIVVAGERGAAGANGSAELIGSWVKDPVRVATTGNITLSGLQTVDGVILIAGDRVLLVLQNTPTENGIYIVASGAWSRASDADTAAKLSNALVMVQQGTTNRHKLFRNPALIATLGTDAIRFYEETQGGSVREMAGLSRGIFNTLGDSNYGGRPGWWAALQVEIRHPRSPFATWTHYNHGVSGYTLNGVIQTITGGDQNALPADANPNSAPTAWDGNIWRLVNSYRNADRGGIIIMSLGINDAGLKGARASYGSPTNFPINLDRVINWLLAMLPRTAILLQIPAPFSGDDYIQGATNETDWASDSPDGTVDGGAAYASSYIRAAYLAWQNRHPRVSVWDSAELFGTRIDDFTVDGQDPEGQGALLDDTLHFSALAARRIQVSLLRMLGAERRTRQTTGTSVSTAAMNTDTFWGEWFWCVNTGTTSGGNTTLNLGGSQENLFLGAELFSQRRTASLPIPTHMIDDMERALYLGRFGNARRLVTMKRDVKLYFPGSGTTYSPTSVTFVQIQNNTESYPRFQIRFNGVVMDAADLVLNQPVYIYTNSRLGVPYQSLHTQFNADGTAGGGGAHSPYDFDWYPTVFQFQRGVGTNAIEVKLYAQNQSDGRLVEAGIVGTPWATPGSIVAEGSLGSGIVNATLTLNATNWPSGFLFKTNYRLVGRVTSGTMVGQGTFTARA